MPCAPRTLDLGHGANPLLPCGMGERTVPVIGDCMRRVISFTVVDDEELTLFLVLRALKSGFPHSPVTTFADGTAALAYLRSHPSDCLITDQNMPGLDGEQVIAALRAEGIHLPAIMISNSPYAQAAANSVGVPLIDKACIATELNDAVSALLDGVQMPAPAAH